MTRQVVLINRINKLREQLNLLNIDAFLITKAENIFYLSNFTGGSDAKLLVSKIDNYIITDSRYTEQVKLESPEWEIIETKSSTDTRWLELLKKYKKVAFETSISYKDYKKIQEGLGDNSVATDNVIEKLRMIKEPQEIELLKETAQISTKVFAEIKNYITEGLTEREIANQIVFLLKANGCTKEAFDTIAVAGENAALPHGTPSDRQLARGDMLTLDYGGFYRGYAGDMTRTVVIGEANPKLKDYYAKLLEAQELGVSLVKDGVMAKDIDKAVRDILINYGLAQYFVHSTGHGLGLEVHELPSISYKSDLILQENMVITIEPGIYIKGWGGIRIEDTVIVKSDSCEVITKADKDLLIL